MNGFIKNKYYFIYQNKKKYIIIKKDNIKSNIMKNTKIKIKKNINKFIDKSIVLLKISKVKQIKSKRKLKLSTGSIRVDIIFYQVTKRGSIISNKNETK